MDPFRERMQIMMQMHAAAGDVDAGDGDLRTGTVPVL